jgi:hypothetical protein
MTTEEEVIEPWRRDTQEKLVLSGCLVFLQDRGQPTGHLSTQGYCESNRLQRLPVEGDPVRGAEKTLNSNLFKMLDG